MSEVKVLDNGNVLVTVPISLCFRSGRKRVIFSENDSPCFSIKTISAADPFQICRRWFIRSAFYFSNQFHRYPRKIMFFENKIGDQREISRIVKCWQFSLFSVAVGTENGSYPRICSGFDIRIIITDHKGIGSIYAVFP